MINLNPVAILTVLYLFVNFLSMLFGCINGEIQVETTFFKVESAYLISSFLLQALFLLLLYLLYKVFYKRTSLFHFELRRKWGLSLLVIQIAFIVFNLTMGVNTAGNTERVEGGSVINYLFIILQPDVLVALISVCLKSGFLFWMNILVYLSSMFLRGWMGGTFIIIFLILSRYPNIKVSGKIFFNSLLLLIILFALLPVIIEAKWAMRTGVSVLVFLSNITSYITPENYISGINYLLNRFQHVGHLAIILQNSDDLNEKYISGLFAPYYMDGLPQYLIAKIFNLSTYKASFFLVEYFFNVLEPSWNINTGVVGWLFILQYESILFIIYVGLILFIPYYLIHKYSGAKVLNVLACFSIIYLFHGWLGAYFNLALYACVISILANLKINKPVSITRMK